MKCPQCNKELELAPPVFHNVTNYNSSATVGTLCCGKGVKVYPDLRIKVYADHGPKREGDWGEEIKESKAS